jgi:Rieske 2Fe-2S family protein
MLPAEAYFEASWFEREQRRVFGSCWQLLALRHQLPRSGSILSTSIGVEPVFVARSGDDIRAYSNVCLHRGMRLVAGSMESESWRVRCPYHHWTYDIRDGTLAGVPQRTTEFPDLRVEDCSLPVVPTVEWRGLIFGNLDPTASPDSFTAWLSGYERHCSPARCEDLEVVYQRSVELRCNWKLPVENHIDVLHLWYLHAESLEMYDHTRVRTAQCGPHWASEEPLRDGGVVQLEVSKRGMPPLPGVPEEERVIQRANLIFPNLLEVSSYTRVGFYRVRPVAPERTVLDLYVLGAPGARMSAYGEQRLLNVLNEEDGRTQEQMQLNVRSRYFGQMLARRHESAIAVFHDQVLAAMAEPS